MSQISPPLRILLVGAVVFMAAWLAFLRPGGGTDAAAPTATDAAPATDAVAGNAASAPGQAVEAATGAAQAAGAAAGEVPPAATAGAARTAAAGAPAAAAAKGVKGDLAAADLPRPVTRALERGKVLVLFFWDRHAADDRAVRAELREVGRHGGEVVVHVADVRAISRYAAITRGVHVEQSPSTVVVDRDRQATLLTGYVDSVTIHQAVSDALGGRARIAGRPVNAYFKAVDRGCARAEAKLRRLPPPTTPAGLTTYAAQAGAIGAAYEKGFLALDTPKRHAGFRKAYAAHNAKVTALIASIGVEARGVKDAASARALGQRLVSRSRALQTAATVKWGKYGIGNCLGA